MYVCIVKTLKILAAGNLGKIRGRIPARFWPPGFLLPGENLGEIRGRIPARFWPPVISFPGENLAGILAGIPARFPLGRKIPAAKISPGSRRDSRRDRVLILQGKDSFSRAPGSMSSGAAAPDTAGNNLCFCLLPTPMYLRTPQQ